MMRSIRRLMQMIRCDSVAFFLKEVQPKNPFYYQLLKKLTGWRTGQGNENQNSLQHGTLPLETV